MTERTNASPVWTIMDKKKNGQSTVCRVCKVEFKNSTTTNNLLKHIRNRHPAEFEKLSTSSSETSTQATLQPTIPAALERLVKYKADSYKKKLIDRDVLRLMTDNLQPFSLIESRSFIRSLHDLDPRYELPSQRHLVRSLLPQFYEEIKVKIVQELVNVKDVAITTDIWTSRATEAYLTVTCHFVTAEWDIKTYVLETKRLTVAHTAENIADELKRIMNEWNIKEKVCAIVTDGGANMVAAVKTLCIIHTGIPCFAHILNLVVNNAISVVKEVTEVQQKVENIVSLFHTSVKSADKLEDTQKIHKQEVKKLIQDAPTRFNSTYYMLQRYDEEVEMINTALCLLNQHKMCLTDSENIMVKKIIAALGPFERITREIGAENFITLSKVLPIVHGLPDLCARFSDVKTNKLAEELLNQFKKYFTKIEDKRYIAESAYLDPRFKKYVFSNTDAVTATETKIIRMMQTTENQDISGHQMMEHAQETVEDAPPDELWVKLDRNIMDDLNKTSHPIVRPNLDIRRYKEKRPIRRDENPLKWWKENQALLPQLHGIARKLMCIPAERMFSKAGELISQRRSCLSPGNVNKVLFLNKNVSLV